MTVLVIALAVLGVIAYATIASGFFYAFGWDGAISDVFEHHVAAALWPLSAPITIGIRCGAGVAASVRARRAAKAAAAIETQKRIDAMTYRSVE